MVEPGTGAFSLSSLVSAPFVMAIFDGGLEFLRVGILCGKRRVAVCVVGAAGGVLLFETETPARRNPVARAVAAGDQRQPRQFPFPEIQTELVVVAANSFADATRAGGNATVPARPVVAGETIADPD